MVAKEIINSTYVTAKNIDPKHNFMVEKIIYSEYHWSLIVLLSNRPVCVSNEFCQKQFRYWKCFVPSPERDSSSSYSQSMARSIDQDEESFHKITLKENEI